MSEKTKKEVMHKRRARYEKGGPEHRRKLIDQAVELMGYHRKSAIRTLAAKTRTQVETLGRAGRPRKYDSSLMLPALQAIWLKGQQPCGRRLAAMMPDWIPSYEAFHRRLGSAVREQLMEASSATLDRMLTPLRVQYGPGKRGTKPGTMLRQEIPIRGGSWQENEAGWMEADTVSLCGGPVREK